LRATPRRESTDIGRAARIGCSRRADSPPVLLSAATAITFQNMNSDFLHAGVARERQTYTDGAIASRGPAPVALIPCTPRQLEVFLTAAEDCHFVCTASRLGISQAAVSSHIAALESQIGQPLFVRRRGRKPILSSYGHTLLNEARSSISDADGSDVARPERLTRRRVLIGAGGHLLDDYIRPQLPHFYQRHGDLDIECHYVDSPNQCVSLINEHRIDLLVYTVSNPANFPLHAEILRSVKLGLYIGGELATQRRLSAAELSALPFILPSESSPACRLVVDALRDACIDCRNVAAYVQYAPVAKDLAKRGQGVAVLFDTMISRKDRKDLIELDVELPTMYRTLFRKVGDPDPAILCAESFLREALSR
jgi:DNA-binding transcriptional LysR family regulator